MAREFGPEERILNCLPSPKSEQDWTVEDLLAAGLFDSETPVPPTKDLREDWWEIGDQEDTGSCVGWATADSVLRWHSVKAGKLESKELLSVRFLWMASKESDLSVERPTTFIETAGTFLKAALDVASKFGNVRDSLLPFRPEQLYRGSYETFYTAAATLRIAMYHNLGTDQNIWRRWIATEGPILTRLTVDSTWRKATETDGKLDAYLADTARGGHAIALVGYTQDRFIVRNSWGTYWGDAGFAYASTDYAKMAFTEAYGVRV